MKTLLSAFALLMASASGLAAEQANAQSLSNPGELAGAGGEIAGGESGQEIGLFDDGEVNPDLEEARQRLTSILSRAREITTLEPATSTLPSEDEIAAMSRAEVRSTALAIANASLQAISRSREDALDIQAPTTATSLERIQEILDAELKSDDSGDEDSGAGIDRLVSEMNAAIDSSNHDAENKERLKQLVTNSIIAAEVVGDANELLDSLDSPVEDGLSAHSGIPVSPHGTASSSSSLEALLTWILFGSLAMLALGAGGYALYLRRENGLLFEENDKLNSKNKKLLRKLENAELKTMQALDNLDRAQIEVASERAKTLRMAEERSARQVRSSAPEESPRPPPPPKRNTQIPLLQRDLEAYLSGGGKLRASPYREILEKYGSVFGISSREAGKATLQADDADPQRHVTAIFFEGSEEIAIVPSAYFVSKFSMQFSRELELSEETKSFFEIQSGAAASLSIGKVGRGMLSKDQGITQIQKGTLSGFS